MDKMKVLFFHNTLAVYRIPFFVELAEILDLNVVFTDLDKTESEYGEQACTGFLNHVKHSVIQKKKFISQIKNEIKRSDCSLINLPTPDGKYELAACYACLYYAKKYHKKTAIFWIRWLPDESVIPVKQKIKNFIRNTLVKPIVRKADVCICSGKKSKENFLNLGVAPSNLKSMHYATDVMVNTQDCDINSAYNIPSDRQIILYFGRVIERKGLLWLIKSYEKIRESNQQYCLAVAGNGGAYLSRCKKYCEENGLHDVYFLGLIPSKYRRSFFESSSIFVLPSVFDGGVPEPWGQTVNEALQCGCRVIATEAVGAAYDILDGTNGYMVRAADIDDLANAILKAINTDADRNKMKQSIQDYTCRTMAADFANAYNYAISK